jgi:hypothetical protein
VENPCAQRSVPSKVDPGYVQAYRISEKVIKEIGDNKFLCVGGSIHSNV